MVARIVILVVALVVAAIGAGLVLFYVQSISARERARYDPEPTVVALADIPAGTTAQAALDQQLLGTQDVLGPARLEGAVASLTADQLDLVFVQPVLQGQQLLPARMLAEGGRAGDPLGLDPASALATPEAADPEQARRALTISVTDAARGSTFLQAGRDVSIFVTYTPAGGAPQTCVLLSRVTVLASGATVAQPAATAQGGGTPDEAAEGTVPAQLVTVDIPDQDSAEKLVLGQSLGELYFVQLPLSAEADEFRQGECRPAGELLS